MEFSDYQKIDAMNASTLVAGRISMLHLKRVIDEGPKPATPAMKFGTLVHCMVLEPDEFDKRYVVLPDFENEAENVTDKGKPSKSKATNYYKDKVSEFAKDNAGKEFITDKDLQRARRIAERIHSKPAVKMWLDACSKEVSLAGEICGVQCKSRLDLLGPAILDLKITASVDPFAFWRVFHDLGYGFKLAFYREMASQAVGRQLDVYVIAVETEGDFDCVLFQVPDELLDLEFEAVKKAMEHYKKCREADVWPGVDGGEDMLPLFVPNWAMPETELEWS